ncbi:hypothetical protein B0H13DRAFT_2079327 [Mycena leptocephala]|nr:hypothetical protein B0H13DRAFT_2079327 [Mycena leptocephala]
MEKKRESRVASPSPLSPARSRQPTRSVGVERERAAGTSLLHTQRRKSSSLVREQLRKAAHPPQFARAGRARRVQDGVSGEGGVEQGVPILVCEQLRSGPTHASPLAGSTTRGSSARRRAVLGSAEEHWQISPNLPPGHRPHRGAVVGVGGGHGIKRRSRARRKPSQPAPRARRARSVHGGLGGISNGTGKRDPSAYIAYSKHSTPSARSGTARKRVRECGVRRGWWLGCTEFRSIRTSLHPLVEPCAARAPAYQKSQNSRLDVCEATT